ncbi:MAG: acyl-CoA dehydrogenase, partial [Porticoccaceae bacterium]|nr:acyl-CoA dehydrogenase [Porticoccaceae bacterium]
MDMNLSVEDLAFKNEVSSFLDDNLSEYLRTGLLRTPGVFVEPDIGEEWHKILYKKGWIT